MKRIYVNVFVVLGFLAILPTVSLFAQEAPAVPIQDTQRTELEQQIQSKNRELDELNVQLEATKKQLESTRSDKSKLQQRLNAIQGNIAQLTHDIKSDQVQLQKLGLEIQKLNLDIGDIHDELSVKQSAIGEIIKELQHAEEESMLFTLLRTQTLSDTVQSAEALRELHIKLSADVENLRLLRERASDKLELSSEKKTQISQHQKNLENRKVIVNDQKQEQQKILSVTKNKESEYEKQLTELEKQQQQITEEIEDIDARLRGKINTKGLPSARSGVLGYPVAGCRVSQRYGITTFSKTAYHTGRHNGIDCAAPIGTPVLAAEDGVIAAAGNQDTYCPRGAYGRFVVINHDNNLTTMYAHLSRIAVASGDRVRRGDVIGYSGNSGFSTGPHLHFTVYDRSTFYMGSSRVCGPMPYGGDLDPQKYL